MKSGEIRERFLKYFEGKDHRRVASSSLIPAEDPTLLFANAGMNQFKDLFLGHKKSDYVRATSSQKCVRAGGKHNDLDNVGYTARHHTFFEMLGNFSFGDYFKEDAVAFAWEFLTEEMGIAVDRLYVTVYEEDDEAFAIWRDKIGVPETRIFRFGKKDNFWSMGDTGPCGPCSEIFYDFGDGVEGPADPYEAIASGSDKVVEIWNLVFMQFDCAEDGTMTPLPNPSIDTGMGLERISCVMQGVTTNYDTDLFQEIIRPVAAYLNVTYGEKDDVDAGLRVIADHLRAMSFLIADGVVPSNEGRGYVLRRIMRRAMRFGKQMGQESPFLFKMIDHVVAKMGDVYPELVKEQANIRTYVEVEEKQFEKTLNKGMPLLLKYLEQFKEKEIKVVPGQVMFELYDTHGFPVDLMDVIARDWEMTLDHAGFEQLIKGQDGGAGGGTQAAQIPPCLVEDAEAFQTHMFCYEGEGLKGKGTIKRILVGGEPIDQIKAGDKAQIVLDATSFYAESGGQVGDKGVVRAGENCFNVDLTTKVLDHLVLHEGELSQGVLKVGDSVETEVNRELRRDTMKNHTATHLVHKALREVLGSHVRQAGSLVDPDKLRFDFNHYAPMSAEEIAAVEKLVNDQVLENTAVETKVMGIEEARESGAVAFFGEKYGETVRVVGVGEFSKEFCGGTHVQATGEIGVFKIVSERGLASGVRRIIALTGPRAVARFQESEMLLAEARDRFYMERDSFIDQIQRVLDEKKALERKIDELKMQLAKGGGSSEAVEDLGAYKVISKKVSEVGGGQLRQLADELLHKIKTGVVLLGADMGDKVQLLVKSNVAEVHAGNLVRDMAGKVGGRGGGKPDMAMAGGKDTEKIDEALAFGVSLLKG